VADLTIREFQNLMRMLYEKRDQKRGIEKSLMWLQTELGELFEAFLGKNKDALEEEIADIFAWLSSVCNLLDIDIEKISLLLS
jgi:NTP pyrophosphatase (non-canonical NTP hydrolase)